MKCKSVLTALAVWISVIAIRAQVQPPPAPWRGAGATRAWVRTAESFNVRRLPE
jgi:hypothetical protein